MIRRWWSRSAAKEAWTAPHYELDPRVPPSADWPRRGIVGRIGSGAHAGELVFAYDDRVPGAEGGLIDELTRGVDVTWSVDEEADRGLWDSHDAGRG
ncbi:hypothetical protein NB037_16700 [Rathayibacter sp. ZW T2_19]|uniref:Uncharacterized protein n=1 Tax=Rathayibacter rubneri TaxID=2950106 RepID=A0A9X2E469_9MICO|nr:hypothetical protein [Rathayibacter rubneri]MCM6764056.1 hypothetical protein [Rathayibacter rubneri]